MEHNYIDQAQPIQTITSYTMVPEIKQVEDLLYETIGTDKGTIGDICTYLLKSGGKRLRPLLIILSGKTLSTDGRENLIAAGAAAELIHMASLVHDDIIDKSLYRRGQPSIHSLWGQQNAVLAGDFLFAKAFDLLVSHQLFPVLQLMVKAIQEMCRGEIIQSTELFQTNQKEEEYFQRIEQKTGTLLAACCQSGAIIAHAAREEEMALKNYGTYLGYTYQIIDDLLDFSGDSQILGKPVCQDLSQGNITLPLLYLIQDPIHGPWVKKIIAQRELNSANCAAIVKLINDKGYLEQAKMVAVHCGDTAKEELSKIPDSIYQNMLVLIIDQALKRNH